MTAFFTGIILATVVIFKGDHGISLGFSYYRIRDIIGYIYIYIIYVSWVSGWSYSLLWDDHDYNEDKYFLNKDQTTEMHQYM